MFATNQKTSSLALLGLALLGFSACTKEEPKDSYEIPTTYNFANVSYTGQTQRLDMLTELGTYMKSAHIADAPALDAQKMRQMYRNEGNQFAGTGLNSSGKQLKDKTAQSIQDAVELWMDSLAAASAYTSVTNPSEGQPGITFKNDGSVGYLLNAKGFEIVQAVEKGLMGACFYYQATAVYLGEGKMNVDNTTIVDGQGTAMEHHWDEAFGYWGVPIDFPTNTSGLRFWGRYTNSRNAVMALNSPLMAAFLKGRAAITNKDLPNRDIAITQVRRNWEKIVGGTAISYLNIAKNNFSTDMAVKHHALSEGFAFILSLKFGGDATISASEVDNVLIGLFGTTDPLQANIYQVTETRIQTAIDALANVLSLQAQKNDL